MNVLEFLVAPTGFLAPDKAIEGLSPQEAERRIDGAPHSIAEIVAHMAFWQDWFLDRCLGRATPAAATAAEGWPEVANGAWPSIQERFVEGLGELAKLVDGDLTKPVTPAIELPMMAHYTIQEALLHAATHNAHHLGQVILLRQMQGAWPPPAGSFTW